MKTCYAAGPNHPNVFILFQHKMKGLFLMGAAASALIVACAPPSTTPSRIPSTEIPRPNPQPVLPPFQMDTSRSVDRVPPFQETPLIVWGPPPDGVTHPERVRRYDLRSIKVDCPLRLAASSGRWNNDADNRGTPGRRATLECRNRYRRHDIQGPSPPARRRGEIRLRRTLSHGAPRDALTSGQTTAMHRIWWRQSVQRRLFQARQAHRLDAG